MYSILSSVCTEVNFLGLPFEKGMSTANTLLSNSFLASIVKRDRDMV